MPATPDRPVLVVAGPTAGGKSALAVGLAREMGGVIVNADSMQVYAELRVLTARPDAADEAAAPHRLYGVLSAAEPCSAARWQAMAVEEIRAAWGRGLLPIVVGGTGLYIRALVDGLSDLPEVPAEVRARAMARRAELGAQAFHAEVAALDPAAARRLPPSDAQRLIRAWEVATATGRPLSAWQAAAPIPPLPEARFATIAILPERAALRAACDARFDRMMAEGALDEVRALADLGLPPDLPAMKALGVPELAAFARGQMPLDEAVSRAKAATRQYAKRQCTWLRHQLRADKTINAQYSESMRDEIFSFIRHFLLTGAG